MINSKLEQALKLRGWEYFEDFEDEAGRFVLIVRTKGEDDDKLHDFRVCWGYMAFARHKEDPNIVRFTTL